MLRGLHRGGTGGGIGILRIGGFAGAHTFRLHVVLDLPCHVGGIRRIHGDGGTPPPGTAGIAVGGTGDGHGFTDRGFGSGAEQLPLAAEAEHMQYGVAGDGHTVVRRTNGFRADSPAAGDHLRIGGKMHRAGGGGRDLPTQNLRVCRRADQPLHGGFLRYGSAGGTVLDGFGQGIGVIGGDPRLQTGFKAQLAGTGCPTADAVQAGIDAHGGRIGNGCVAQGDGGGVFTAEGRGIELACIAHVKDGIDERTAEFHSGAGEKAGLRQGACLHGDDPTDLGHIVRQGEILGAVVSEGGQAGHRGEGGGVIHIHSDPFGIVFTIRYDGTGENIPADGMRHKIYPGRGGACSSRFVQIGSAKRGEAEFFAIL